MKDEPWIEDFSILPNGQLRVVSKTGLDPARRYGWRSCRPGSTGEIVHYRVCSAWRRGEDGAIVTLLEAVAWIPE